MRINFMDGLGINMPHKDFKSIHPYKDTMNVPDYSETRTWLEVSKTFT